MLDLYVRRENEDADVRASLSDGFGGDESLDRVGGRHPDVDDEQVRVVAANDVENLSRVRSLRDDVMPGANEQAR